MSKVFKVTSGTMVCSDPCYSIPTWCQGIVSNVKNGNWEAGIETSDEGSWGERIARLWVYNLEAAIKDPSIVKTIENGGGHEMPFSAGVDSGQFGFFDHANYRKDDSAKDLPQYDFGGQFGMGTNEGDAWYGACCHLTLGEENWGVLPNGVVSSSGYGDGSYGVTGIKNDEGQYIAFCVVFIGNDDEGDNDDLDWGDWNETTDED